MKLDFAKKFYCIMLVFCLLCSGISPLTVTASATEEVIGSATVFAIEKYGENIRDYLREQLSAYETEIDLSGFHIPYTNEGLDIVADYIFYQMPEAFHVSNMNFAGSGGNLLRIEPIYDMPEEEYLSLLSSCSDVADTILDGIKDNDTLTDAEKMLLVHDRLALRTSYDERVFQNDSEPEESKNITGCLLKGVAQCQGYSMTYIYLLQKLGLQCCVTLSRSCCHMWNIVWLDNKPYHVDVTYDDPYPDMTGRVCHDHFLRSTYGLGQADAERKGCSDYDTTPTDTTYDGAYWQQSESCICPLNGILYYVDTAGNVRRADTKEVIFAKTAVWKASQNSTWRNTYYHLCAAGNSLYFSDSGAIYRIDPETKKSEVFYTPTELLKEHSCYGIFGFDIQDGILRFDFYNSPDFTGLARSTYHYEITMDSISDDWQKTGEEDDNEPDQPPVIIYGSVDGDAEVTSGDARLVLRCSVQLEEFTEAQEKAADVDGKDGITAADARLILRYSVKLETSFPAAG